ncbi:MAG: xanthine dehydrogenase family protein molybdopterin-binding subunit [Saprospiraceae bacterium]|nr:xanthine dehydrogenase family protein molybdopterin-binding subunit [Saprospiraceae bacterium]
MENNKTTYSRRSFLKVSALTGSGMMLGINWLAAAKSADKTELLNVPDVWTDLNAYIKITADNKIQIFAPNPEFGQNTHTSQPMIVAEELDADWANVTVEQAPHDNKLYGMQFTGGSNTIRATWKPLRQAGAAARQMLREAAAKTWGVPVDEVTTEKGVLYHKSSGKSAQYGAMAAAAAKIPVPTEAKLKALKDMKIVRSSRKNVDGSKIVTGKPLFGLDYRKAGMLTAMVEHPPAFGMKLKSFDAAEAKKMAGIKDVFTITVYDDKFEKGGFDVATFNEVIAIVGNSTWEVMQARKKLKIEWEKAPEKKEMIKGWGGNKTEQITPAGLETTEKHIAKMAELMQKPAKELRKDGDPEAAFKSAAQVIERTYTAPFLAHNTMEPMNCFAHVTDTEAFFASPLQAPVLAQPALAARLGLPADKVTIEITRMGGGFGRRAYHHYMIEAGLISQKAKAPVKLIYTREDDMSYGIYRPMYTATYRAALDANKQLIAFHVKGGGIPEHPIHANRFPAGAVDNYLAEGFEIPSNITIGAFRAPRSNFNAAAEQSFLDEVAEAMGKDPIQMRLDLLQRAKDKPVGKNNEYDADRYAGVLKLVRDQSGWGKPENQGKNRGVAAYFCHASYAAHIIDMSINKDNEPQVDRVVSAMDCGVVINPDAARNMVEGAVTDGVGNALYGNMSFQDGKTAHNNLNTYRIIRMNEAPKKIEVHFVENDIDPTGLGEPPFPPVFGAMANALYKATGKRYYLQPFGNEINKGKKEG